MHTPLNEVMATNGTGIVTLSDDSEAKCKVIGRGMGGSGGLRSPHTLGKGTEPLHVIALHNNKSAHKWPQGCLRNSLRVYNSKNFWGSMHLRCYSKKREENIERSYTRRLECQ